ILLAEDNPLNQKIVAQMLHNYGFYCHVVNNGLECLEALHREPFDVVLLDMQMPGMDGLSTLKALRDQGFTGRVVLMTAHHEQEILDNLAELGVHHTLVKPFDIFELEKVLQASLTGESCEFCAC
ncbi:MAG TPA: response regulator, partial [Clostridia bacterium]|nr:response regulator [Clostridia bacterium]